jgi:hypothetical protein
MVLKRVMVAAAAVGAAVFGLAVPANATEHNGDCESGEFCLYYSPYYAGGTFDMYYSDGNLNDNYFVGTSLRVGNNSASAWNNDGVRWYVYTGTGYTGSSGWYDPGDYNPQMTSFRNQIESARY